MTMTLYGGRTTRAGRCIWMLEELSQPYHLHVVDFRGGEHRSPEYLKLNPNGKVPTLVDGDLVLSESAAIVTYLGDRFPQAGLVPEPRTAERARYDQWLFFCMTELEQPLWTISKHKFALPRDVRIPEMKQVARFEFGRAKPIVEQHLATQPYILGDRFTAADLLIGHTLIWAQLFGVPLESERLEQYVTELQQRPAYQRMIEK